MAVLVEVDAGVVVGVEVLAKVGTGVGPFVGAGDGAGVAETGSTPRSVSNCESPSSSPVDVVDVVGGITVKVVEIVGATVAVVVGLGG